MIKKILTAIAISGILFLMGCSNGNPVTVSPSGELADESLSADFSEAAEGVTVTLTASLNSGRQVELSASGVTFNPSVISSNGGTATFTMPAAAVEVEAVFSDIPVNYTVKVSSYVAGPDESVRANVIEATEGTTVTLTASLNSGRQVTLSASGVTFTPSTIRSDGGTATFTMPAAEVKVTAVFSDFTYAVTVSPSEAIEGESVSANLSDVVEGDIVTLTASLKNGRQVVLSASGVSISPSVISSDGGTATFTMPAASVSITATFSDFYEVTVFSIDAVEPVESVNANFSKATEGTTVTLTAFLKGSRQVSLSATGVSISPSVISSDGGTATFTMPAAKVIVTATFSDTYDVTINPTNAGTGDSVSANLSKAVVGATVTLTASLNSDRQVDLSASGVTFSPSIISNNGDTATFTMPAKAVNITATFSDILYTVTVSAIGRIGEENIIANVNKAAAGATVTLNVFLNSGREVVLDSTSGGSFNTRVLRNNNSVTTEKTATFTMPKPGAAVEITAAFRNIPAAAENGFTGTLAIGDAGTVSLDSESLKMIYANDSSSITFPTGKDDSVAGTLTTRFWMGETELTNAVMAEVLQWAYDNGRFSTIVGDSNGLDTTTVKHGGQQLLDLDAIPCQIYYNGSGRFTAESGYGNNPVTNITWYGAVMFCNWLTEMRDGNKDNLVYTNIDASWVDDETNENTSLNGYRLPSVYEWEYAARYLGTTAPTTGGKLDTERKFGDDNPAWTNGYYWTPGNYASGAYTYYNDVDDVNPANGVVDNKDANDKVAVYDVYYDEENKWVSKGLTDEAAVKSLGVGSANALGIYDMSGNVAEWCFTGSPGIRQFRSSKYFQWSDSLQVGMICRTEPDYDENAIGFRLCRTAD